MSTTISKGNSKVGRIPNVSLAPCKTCRSDAPCRKTCYALKSWKQYPNVRKAWGANTEEATKRPERYFGAIREFLAKRAPRFFRWHVAGDIPTEEYAREVFQIAREFPETAFLMFTKRPGLLPGPKSRCPQNLSVVVSMWPGWSPGRARGYSRSWVQDGSEKRIPAGALECPGNCESCGACWSLAREGRDVWFAIHYGGGRGVPPPAR